MAAGSGSSSGSGACRWAQVQHAGSWGLWAGDPVARQADLSYAGWQRASDARASAGWPLSQLSGPVGEGRSRATWSHRPGPAYKPGLQPGRVAHLLNSGARSLGAAATRGCLAGWEEAGPRRRTTSGCSETGGARCTDVPDELFCNPRLPSYRPGAGLKAREGWRWKAAGS